MPNLTLPNDFLLTAQAGVVEKPESKPESKPDPEENVLMRYRTDGKDRSPKTKEQQIREMEELSDLLDLKSTNYFGTFDKQVFAKKLETMTLSDKRDLGMKVGTMFYERERDLDKALIGAFDDFMKRYRNNLVGPVQESIKKDSPEYKRIESLL